MPNKGDEFINTADRLQWLHDGNQWRQRPFADRIVADVGGVYPSAWNTNLDPWTTLPDIAAPFHKVSNSTDIEVSGWLTGWLASESGTVYLTPWLYASAGLVGGNPPPATERFGYYLRSGTLKHAHMHFSRRFTGVRAGTQRVEMMTGTGHGFFYIGTSDFWSMTVREVGP